MLTARDLLRTDFRQTLRGYHPKDVDEFVQRVVSAYESLSRTNKQLVAELEEARELLKEEERAAARRNALMEEAHTLVGELKAEAADEGDRLVEEAERRAEEIVARAEGLEAEARSRVRRWELEERQLRERMRTLLEASLRLLDEEPAQLKKATLTDVTVSEPAAASD